MPIETKDIYIHGGNQSDVTITETPWVPAVDHLVAPGPDGSILVMDRNGESWSVPKEVMGKYEPSHDYQPLVSDSLSTTAWTQSSSQPRFISNYGSDYHHDAYVAPPWLLVAVAVMAISGVAQTLKVLWTGRSRYRSDKDDEEELRLAQVAYRFLPCSGPFCTKVVADTNPLWEPEKLFCSDSCEIWASNLKVNSDVKI